MKEKVAEKLSMESLDDYQTGLLRG